MFRTLSLLTLAALVGCAGPRAASELPDDHPANPAAATAPLPPASNALSSHDPLQPAATRDEHGNHAVPQPTTPQYDHAAHAAPPATTPDAAPAPQAATYVCPMHPEVTSHDPAARCPKCGMRLEEPTK